MPSATPALVAGRYAVRRVLAVGGMSTVHLAHDLRLGREVALKVFRTSGDGRDADRLRQEGELLARLAHPNLVRGFDAGADEDGSNAWLALELLTGPNLAVALHDHGPLPARDVRRLLGQVADALAYIHALGIVHRDVKPSNVLLTADPRVEGEWAAKLADFGIAAELGAGRMLAGDAPAGTAAYFSPEQALGQPVTPASDVYALGLVALEALTGERAFPGGAVESATARLFRQPTLPEWLDDGWRALLETMTARDPRARPTAGQVRAASRSLAPTLAVAPAARAEYDADVRTEPATLLAAALVAGPASVAEAPVQPAPARRPRFPLLTLLPMSPGFADRFSRRALVVSSAGVLVLCTAAGGTALVAAAPARPIIPLEEALPTAPPAVAALAAPRPTPSPEVAATPRPRPAATSSVNTGVRAHAAATSPKATDTSKAAPRHARPGGKHLPPGHARHAAKQAAKAAKHAAKLAAKQAHAPRSHGGGAAKHGHPAGKHH